MPSVSWKQHRFMEAIKHSPEFARKAGVPQSVGQDFANADDAAGITKSHSDKRRKRLADTLSKNNGRPSSATH